MTYRVTDILQIMPAEGWFFEDQGEPKKRLADYVPVARFVMVTYANDEAMSDVIMKRALPLDRHNYTDLEWLVGKAVEDFDTQIIHRTQIEALLLGEEFGDEGDNLMSAEPFRSFVESRRAG